MVTFPKDLDCHPQVTNITSSPGGSLEASRNQILGLIFAHRCLLVIPPNTLESISFPNSVAFHLNKFSRKLEYTQNTQRDQETIVKHLRGSCLYRVKGKDHSPFGNYNLVYFFGCFRIRTVPRFCLGGKGHRPQLCLCSVPHGEEGCRLRWKEVGVTVCSFTHGILLQTARNACLQDSTGASGVRKRDLMPWRTETKISVWVAARRKGKKS